MQRLLRLYFGHWISFSPSNQIQYTTLQYTILYYSTEWAENALAQLRQCCVAQDYPCSIIDAQFARVLHLNCRDVIFHVKTVKPTSKYKRGLLLTYHKKNPPYRNWIDQAARETLYSDPEFR